MVDFVLNEVERKVSVVSQMICIENYANFLKQPLEIWQFLPCKLVDGVWVTLEEPDGYVHGKTYLGWEKDDYSKAKSRCIFEGFEIDYDRIVKNNEIRIQFNDYSIYLNNSKTIIKTIEDLVKYNLQLNASAIKELGL